MIDLKDRTTDSLRDELAQLSRHIDEGGAISHHDVALEDILTREIARREDILN